MAIDTSIYNGLMQRPKSVAEYDADRLQLQQAQQQNRLADLVYGEKQREIGGDNALASLLAGGKSGADVSQGLAAAGYGNKALSYTKTLQEQEKQRADIDHLKSQSGKLNAETLEKALETTRSFANQIDSPQAAAMYLKGVYAHPLLGPVAASMMPIDQAMASIPQDMNSPDGLRWKAAHVNLNGKDLLGLLMPKTDSTNLGGNQSFGKTDQFSGVRTQTVAAPITQSADNKANNATSRANNASTIAAENLRAGVMPGGGLDDNAERTAKAIASGQLPAPTGMALLNPKNQRILGRVMEINPDYDASTVSAKKAAATAFTSGNQGNAMRSFAVAGDHLDQLGKLVDAMDNGNMQLINNVANLYSQQTGSPAVTNFDAAKDVVSKEVIKAIVGGGGGVSERQELSDMMKNVKSPAQLKGVITQYRGLMAAQYDALLQQRRAAGLPDSTLPTYNSGKPAAGASADLHSQAEAILRGGK